MQINIRTNFPDVAKALGDVQDKLASQVLARSLNRTIEQARTEMSRQIRAEYNLSAAKVGEKLRIKRATFTKGQFEMAAELFSKNPDNRRGSINLINFSARETKAGLTFKIKKRGGRGKIGPGFIGNKGQTAFIRTGEQKRVMTRGVNVGKLREPIRPLRTIDVPQMFNTRRINAAVQAAMHAKFPAIFQRELAFAMSRLNR